MKREERIAALLKNEHNAVRSQKALEAMTDDELTAAEAKCGELKTAAENLKAAADKAAGDAQTINERLTADEAAIKAAGEITEEQALARFPSLKALSDNAKAAEQAEKDALVAKLKVASSALTEEQLKAKSLDELRTLAAFAKVDAVDFGGRGMPRAASAAPADSFTPADPYAKGIAALQGSKAN